MNNNNKKNSNAQTSAVQTTAAQPSNPKNVNAQNSNAQTSAVQTSSAKNVPAQTSNNANKSWEKKISENNWTTILAYQLQSNLKEKANANKNRILWKVIFFIGLCLVEAIIQKNNETKILFHTI